MKKMIKLKNFIYNLFSILISISLIFIANKYTDLSLFVIIIYFFIFSILYNFLISLILTYNINGKNGVILLIESIKRNKLLIFTLYGCYCSPKYGLDGLTKDLKPIDELDCSCFKHDESMLDINKKYSNNIINKIEYNKLKNKEDLIFLSRVFTSNTYCSGYFLIGLLIGFIFRIINRILFSK